MYVRVYVRPRGGYVSHAFTTINVTTIMFYNRRSRPRCGGQPGAEGVGFCPKDSEVTWPAQASHREPAEGGGVVVVLVVTTEEATRRCTGHGYVTA